jgi:hypothetical protein
MAAMSEITVFVKGRTISREHIDFFQSVIPGIDVTGFVIQDATVNPDGSFRVEILGFYDIDGKKK